MLRSSSKIAIPTSGSDSTLPQHVAIIMDGNGRWAKCRSLRRFEGHNKGVEKAKEIIQACLQMSIPYLTLYTFSTENWSRSAKEVSILMKLLSQNTVKHLSEMLAQGIRLRVIGNMKRVPLAVNQGLKKSIRATEKNDKLHLTLAISYGSRWEIVEIIKQIARSVTSEKIKLGDINESYIQNALTTNELPDPDLLIRTGGEQRISNFLLYQMAYTELYFTKTYWPDFGKQSFRRAIRHFQSRNRTFGSN